MSWLLCLAVVSVSAVAPSAPWREFRGLNGTGVYDGPPVVTQFSPTENLGWQAAVPGKGWSTPIIVNELVVVTTAVPANTMPKADQSLRALAFNKSDGTLKWDVELFTMDGKKGPAGHSKNSFASPTPVSDGQRIFVHFGHLGTAALDLSGKILWKVDSHKYAPVHGNGGSLILVKDALIYSADGADQQFVVALDTKSGETKWKTNRTTTAKKRFSFTTPLAYEANGETLIISAASEFVAAYRATDGTEAWRCRYPAGGYSVISRPIIMDGILIIQTGYDTPYLFALKLGGTGDISSQIVWSTKKGAPHTPSPIGLGREVYCVSDSGVATAYDLGSGDILWTERLRGKGYSSSPIIANGNVYFCSEDGMVTTIEVGRTFKEIGKGTLGERTFATFVPDDGKLYARTETKLYQFVAK